MWILLLLSVVGATDITTYRASLAPVPGVAKAPPAFCPGLLPLCGNGVIDKKTSTYSLRLRSSEIVKDTSYDQFYNITVAVDEVCDDGNNIDGDGCSSDCMDFDAWTPSCELHVDVPRTYEDVAFSEDGTLYFSAPDGIYTLTPTLQHMATLLVAPKSVAVNNIYINRTDIWLWSASTSSVYKVVNGALSLMRNAALQSTNNQGKFVITGSGLLLLCYDSNSAKIINLNTMTETQYTISLPHVVNILWLKDQQSFMLFLTGLNQILIPLSGTAALLPKQMNNNLWQDTVNAALSSVSSVQLSQNPVQITLNPSNANMMIALNKYTGGVSYITPWGAGSSLATLHAICAGSQYQRSIGIGNSLILQDLGQNPTCTSGNACMLDLPMAAGIAQQDIKNTGKTFFQAFAEILGQTDPRPPYSQAFTDALVQFTTLVQSNTQVQPFTINPLVKSMILWNGNSIYEIGKTGTAVKKLDNGKCLTSALAPCPPCMWASAGSKCQPCSTKADTWAWKVQCDGCGIGRRLLSVPELSVVFSVQGQLSAVQALWPGAKVRGEFIDVVIPTVDPGQTLHDVQNTLRGTTLFVSSQPRVIYNAPGSASAEKKTEEGVQWWGWLLIALAVALVVGLGMWWWFRRPATNPYVPLPSIPVKLP